MDIRFGDHSSFHRAAAGMVGAGALVGFGLHAFTPMAPLVGGLAGIAIGTSFGYGKTAWRLAAAAAACVPLLLMTPSWPMLAAIASIMALGTSVGGLRGMRGLLAVMLGVVTTLLAIWGGWRIGHAQQTVHWPLAVTDTVAGAAMGMIGILAMLPRHLTVSSDPVAAAVRGLPATIDGEVRGLCDRSIAIWASTKQKLAADDPSVSLVRDGVLKALEVAAKSADAKVEPAADAALAKRIEDLDTRIAAASDAEVKAQYQSARGALEDQQRYRERIRQNHDRLIARMHNHVAALEKFQLAVGAAAVQQLAELSHDVAASGEALAELELGASASA